LPIEISIRPFKPRHPKIATIGAIYSVCMILMLTSMGLLFFDETPNRYEIVGIVLAIACTALRSRFA
jgi:small multidrug resistance pump